MNILFAVWSSYPKERIYADPSVWYRCYQPAEALRRLGHQVSVEHFTEVLDTKNNYDVVIFFRPQFSDEFVRFFYQVEATGAVYAASYDDLFFDIGLLRHTNFRGQGVAQKKILDSRPYNYAQAFYFFDRFIVSTDSMRDSITASQPDCSVHVLYNALSPAALEFARIASVDQIVERVPRRVGYFAGGAAHSIDLARVAREIAHVIVKCDAEFFCVETVEVPPVLKSTGRVVTSPRMTYQQMIMAYASCCVTVAPLAMDEFTAGKSGIKYLEASAVGAASVATPIPDILRVADERLLPATQQTDWEQKLAEALELPSGPDIAAAQQHRLRENFSTIGEAQKLLIGIDEWLKRPAVSGTAGAHASSVEFRCFGTESR
ncbi:hypothetical protein BLJAPNOD_05537 [Ensifer sp. M14]|uniref:glycosyltransferase n=1 Tax=Ensifer sp. M14 TaxID=2203782 RepID=UPI000E2CD500|nr:glycosyltransferase [Ensifer sp. M14]RDL47613.1 hypothetical protein BLJAPNOD_05537 [Ensifer sp. M14]